ncbi:DLA class II histocompatibility antigen, DR-1 beta chain-like [Rhinoraja longicauda]
MVVKALKQHDSHNASRLIWVSRGMMEQVDDGVNSHLCLLPPSALTICMRGFDFLLSPAVEPKITVRPKASSHAGQSALLTCHVTGFYPPEIEVTWLKNGAPVPNGAINTVLLSDGDWTYQVEELLQYQPVSGDTYTCRVEHSSLAEPMAMDWDVQSSSESEKTKIIVGALGFVFGLTILLAGVIMKLRNAKAILDSTSHGPRLMGAAIS